MITRRLSRQFPLALISAALLLSSTPSLAAIQEQTFSITGDNGESRSGTFTWDDTVVPDGSILNSDTLTLSANVLSVNITITGGNVVGGSTTFTRADCYGAYLELTPDFTTDINWWCTNGSNILRGRGPNENRLNMGQSILTFTPGTTATVTTATTVVEVPTSSGGLLAIMAGITGLLGLLRIKRKAAKNAA